MPGNLKSAKITCLVEMKTQSGTLSKVRALRVATKCGNYFPVEAGEDNWFEAVSRKNCGQVLAQADALGLQCVLCTGSAAGFRLCSALIHVTEQVNAGFVGSITKRDFLMAWASDSISTCVEPPEPHPAFNKNQKCVLSTHLRMWQAVRKLTMSNNCLMQQVGLFK